MDPNISTLPEKHCCAKCIIPVDSEWHAIWQIFIGLLSLVTCVNYAYFAAFAFPYEFKSLGDFFGAFNSRMSDNFMILFWFFVEIIFVVDIVLHFLKEFRSEINFHVVRYPRLIARRYLRTSFVFDLIATIPGNLIIYAFSAGKA